MAVYEGITYSRQDVFDIEEDIRSERFEFEEGESATKIAYLLCDNAALIGEFVISDDDRNEILREARRVFIDVCAGKTNMLPRTDGRILTVACVLLTRTSLNESENESEQDRGEIWERILQGLNYAEAYSKTGCSKQMARKHLCDMLKDSYNVRFFADGGQKYYNTLRIHALSPEWSIKNLCNVLYAFYHKNLECSYFPGTNVGSLFVSGIRRRWVTATSTSADKQNIQSDHLASSLRELFVLRPKFMAAVCDALLEKIDSIVQGDITKIDIRNRWDLLLQEWYLSKTAYEKEQMTNDRKAAVRRKVVDRKENIRPEYSYENKSICLSVPGIRLPEIQQAPVLELYQNDQLVHQQRLSIYGNDVLWSTRSHKIVLNQIAGINWKKRFCFKLRIVSGESEIYNSKSTLFREFLCFTQSGAETKLIRCSQMLYLVVRRSANLVIDDPEYRYIEEAAPYRIFGLWTESINRIMLNGTDILVDTSSGTKRIWAYLTPESDSTVCAMYESEMVSVYPVQPLLHVVMQKQTDAKNYQVTIDDNTKQLYQYVWTDGQFRIPLPAYKERKHVINIKDFDSGEIVFQRSYTVIPGLACKFDKPFYLDRDHDGKLFIKTSTRSMVHDFHLRSGKDKVRWEMLGLTFEITAPKVYAEICERNAFYLSKAMWHEKLKDSFLSIRKPDNVTCAVIFGSKVLQPNYAGNYEIGAEIDNIGTSEDPVLVGILVNAGTWKLEWKLTEIQFRESFKINPIIQDGRKILWNPLDAGYIGGDETPSFRLVLDNDQQDAPFHYALTMKPDIVERHFPCKAGTYKYSLLLTNRSKMFLTLPDLTLLQGKVTIEDQPEDRFAGKHIILTHAYYEDPQSGQQTSSKMRRDAALIDFIEYEGTRDREGVWVHEYSGNMFFRTQNGWIKFSEEENNLYEKINPVYFTVEQDNHVVVYLDEDETLMLNTKLLHQPQQFGGVQIYSRKDELTPDEQGRYLAFADKFRFIERYE